MWCWEAKLLKPICEAVRLLPTLAHSLPCHHRAFRDLARARWLGGVTLVAGDRVCLSQGMGPPGDCCPGVSEAMKLHMANQASSRHQCSPPRAFGAAAWSSSHGSNTHLSLALWQQSRGPPWAWTRHCGPPAPPTARPGELALDSKVERRQEEGRKEGRRRLEGKEGGIIQCCRRCSWEKD